MLGRHVGHDSCCCSAVSQPANGLSKLVSAMGRCGRSFVFLGCQYATLEIRGRCAGKACWARFLLLFGCPANGLSKLASAMGRCGRSFVFFTASVRDVRDSGPCAGQACWARFLAAVRLFRNQPMDSQSWFLQWVGVAEALFFRASVRDSGRWAWKACWARFLLLFGYFGTSQWTLKAGFCNR